MMIGDLMKIFKKILTRFWYFFDILMFIAAVLTINIVLFTQVSLLAGGISLAISFVAVGLASEIIEEHIESKKGGD
ncbi:DUF1056 family protein [Lactococcus lactis]|uniref:DUF1056 family protein n=2 Tax=Lactococcus lactis TaxID=1358 RepID=A0A443L3L7_9LACT|nr:DUF1056 family protein [Lactococcus lactis]RWR43625.1 DUF1056 family protein [Lactococcus lactis]